MIQPSLVVSRRYRPGTPISLKWAMVILGVVIFAASTIFWRGLIMETERTVENQVDYEDAALCIKFGFARGTAQHDACKLDLLDLRHSDEDLVAQTSLP